MSQARLVVEGRGNWVYTHPFGDADTVKIGRGPGNDVEVNDFHTSSEHAVIQRRGEDFILHDAGSRNGTFLNGKKLEGELLLRSGDRIRVGVTFISFLTDSEESHYSLPGIDAIQRNDEDERDLFPDLEDELDLPAADAALLKELREARESIRMLKIINEFTRLVASRSTSLQRIEAALRFMAVQVGAENGFIMQISSKTEKWSVRARFGDILDWTGSESEAPEVQLPMSLTVVDHVIRECRPCVSIHTVRDPRFNASKSIETLGIQSCLCHPLMLNGAPAGVTYLDRRINCDPFGRWEEKLSQGLNEQLNKLLYPLRPAPIGEAR